MHGMGLDSHMQRALNSCFLRTPGRQLAASLQTVCVSSLPNFCSIVLLLLPLPLLLVPAGSGEQALAGADVGVCL